MMEFVMSRVWMVITGLAVMAVILVAFADLDRGMEREVDMEGASALASAISDLQREGTSAELEVEMRSVMVEQEVSYSINNWVIEIKGVGPNRAEGFYEKVTLTVDGRPVDRLEVGRDDVLLIRSSEGEVQLEKVSTI